MRKIVFLFSIFVCMMFLVLPKVIASNCSNYDSPSSCAMNGCIWSSVSAKVGECASVEKTYCGNIDRIPKKIPELTSFFITVAQVVTAVILVILGSIDLFRGLSSSKEEEIKKGQQTFVKRLIAAVLVFFVVLIVKLLIGAIANATTSSNVISCMDCFLSNSCG